MQGGLFPYKKQSRLANPFSSNKYYLEIFVIYQIQTLEISKKSQLYHVLYRNVETLQIFSSLTRRRSWRRSFASLPSLPSLPWAAPARSLPCRPAPYRLLPPSLRPLAATTTTTTTTTVSWTAASSPRSRPRPRPSTRSTRRSQLTPRQSRTSWSRRTPARMRQVSVKYSTVQYSTVQYMRPVSVKCLQNYKSRNVL